jgi:hypothetical protein
MGTIWEKIKKGVSEGYQSVSDKTEEMTRIGRLKLEILAIKRDIEKDFIELGGRFYQAVDNKKQKDILTDQQVMELVKKIKKSEDKLKSLEEKIIQIRDQVTARKKKMD